MYMRLSYTSSISDADSCKRADKRVFRPATNWEERGVLLLSALVYLADEAEGYLQLGDLVVRKLLRNYAAVYFRSGATGNNHYYPLRPAI